MVETPLHFLNCEKKHLNRTMSYSGTVFLLALLSFFNSNSEEKFKIYKPLADSQIFLHHVPHCFDFAFPERHGHLKI